MNLLQETLDALKENGKTPADVRWVGRASISAKCTWEDFAKQANLEYNNRYGWMKIPADLVAVGDNWWLEREEDDVAEWWEFKAIPKVEERDSHAFSRCLELGVESALRVTQGCKDVYYDLLQTPESVILKGNGTSEQDGEKPSLDGRGGPRAYSFVIKLREYGSINARDFVGLIGEKRKFAFTVNGDDGAVAKELMGTTKSVYFCDKNVVKITVEFPAEVKE